MKKVLVLEDEASIRSFIVINLQRAGYEVVEAECGEEALQKLQENPDTKLCLLDIMLPDIDGFEVCRRIRMSNAQVGIIMLTARTQEMDKVTGLMTGADDYVTKPFSPAELTARVDALPRRMGENTPATHTGELYQPPFLLNLTNRTLEKNGRARQADTDRVRDRQALYGKQRQGARARGNSRRRVGQGLLWRAQDRGRECPPPAPQDRR